MAPGHHESHGSGYGNEPWMGLNPYATSPSPQQQQPGMNGMNNYHHGYEYSSTPTPMPMEPTYSMPRPPPYAPSSHPPMPPPLVMPHHNVWPSMLAASSHYQPPMLPAAPVQTTPVSATGSHGSDLTPTSAKTSTSRRKLTDDERRQMCLEAENNPTMKQTQIGAKFNVERSTVSKILRQKEKYMKAAPKEESSSPGKKKTKMPDVEKTLANWARNQQKKGIAVTNDDLRKQVVMFSAGRTDQETLTSNDWLEQFKTKHLSGSDAATHGDEDFREPNPNQSPLEPSSFSPNGLVSPPMSAIDESVSASARDIKNEDVFDFSPQDFRSSQSFSHIMSSELGPQPDNILSPISPELGHGDGLGMKMSHETILVPNTSRQRSQTFSHLAEPGDSSRHQSSPSLAPSITPRLPVRASTTMTELRQASIDPRQTMKRHKSVPDIHDADAVHYSTMQPPPLPRSTDVSPVSHPGSPGVQDDTMKALHTFKQLLEQRPDVAEPDDYVMVGKLMEKLKVLRSPSSTPAMSATNATPGISGIPSLPGGLHPFGSTTGTPRISKKRTVIQMSN